SATAIMIPPVSRTIPHMAKSSFVRNVRSEPRDAALCAMACSMEMQRRDDGIVSAAGKGCHEMDRRQGRDFYGGKQHQNFSVAARSAQERWRRLVGNGRHGGEWLDIGKFGRAGGEEESGEKEKGDFGFDHETPIQEKGKQSIDFIMHADSFEQDGGLAG